MTQFKIYGPAPFVKRHAAGVSRSLHRAAVASLGIPEAKRFMALDDGMFLVPEDRSGRYNNIE